MQRSFVFVVGKPNQTKINRLCHLNLLPFEWCHSRSIWIIFYRTLLLVINRWLIKLYLGNKRLRDYLLNSILYHLRKMPVFLQDVFWNNLNVRYIVISIVKITNEQFNGGILNRMFKDVELIPIRWIWILLYTLSYYQQHIMWLDEIILLAETWFCRYMRGKRIFLRSMLISKTDHSLLASLLKALRLLEDVGWSRALVRWSSFD